MRVEYVCNVRRFLTTVRSPNLADVLSLIWPGCDFIRHSIGLRIPCYSHGLASTRSRKAVSPLSPNVVPQIPFTNAGNASTHDHSAHPIVRNLSTMKTPLFPSGRFESAATRVGCEHFERPATPPAGVRRSNEATSKVTDNNGR